MSVESANSIEGTRYPVEDKMVGALLPPTYRSKSE